MTEDQNKRTGGSTLAILKADLEGDDKAWKKHALALMTIYGERLADIEAKAADNNPDVRLREI
jgi:hypothetical protein